MDSMDGPNFPKGLPCYFFVNCEFFETRENILSLTKNCNFISIDWRYFACRNALSVFKEANSRKSEGQVFVSLYGDWKIFFK